ncbi:MAG: type I-D CRISPR-associated protein Cas7/Csc2 [Desulfurococcales archaeon]|nr:type I-D CRISPR-associated protein Cas7/Csc2 [Desulfurococcales archaeon]
MGVESLLEAVKPCLRRVGEEGRLFPTGKRIEVVFTVTAANFLLLRTEGPGDINEALLPESGLNVPVIQPQKLMAVVRRRLLHALRMHRDSGADLTEFIRQAAELGFTKAEEHLRSRWNCTIQPPLADTGEKTTDIGMDGYCPACTIFGVALTQAQYKKASGDMSVGVKTRVHFDPAFATTRAVQPETHNKVTEGVVSTTGGALFSDIHVMPGTVFIGRVVLHDVTYPELLAVLYSLASIEAVGGRSGVYGTVKVELLGARCGDYSTTTALELADEAAGKGLTKPSSVKGFLLEKLSKLGFTAVSNEEILDAVRPEEADGLFMDLWRSSIDFVKQLDKLIAELRGGGKGRRGKKK